MKGELNLSVKIIHDPKRSADDIIDPIFALKSLDKVVTRFFMPEEKCEIFNNPLHAV